MQRLTQRRAVFGKGQRLDQVIPDLATVAQRNDHEGLVEADVEDPPLSIRMKKMT